MTDMKRRAFIKLTGFSAGIGAGVAFTPIPWQLMDDTAIWTQNWSWIPRNPKGESTYTHTTSKLCPSGCGVKVRLLNGTPLRALSSPEHPLGGGISALAASEVQLMHSPARVQRPLLRTSDGAHIRISWEEAGAMLAEKFREAGKDLLCLSGDDTGTSSAVLSALLSGLGSSKMYFMPSDAQCASIAWNLSRPGRSDSQMGFDIERGTFVLAIGANAMETWGTFIRNRRVVCAKRDEGRGFGMVYAGPVQNQTAAAADSWIAIKPGTEAVFALGLINLLISKYERRVNATGFSALERGAAAFTPDQVEKLTGVAPAALERLCEQLVEASSPIVLCGSEMGQGGGVAQALAGLALNLLIGAPLTSVPLHTASLTGAKSRSSIYRNDFMRAFVSTGGRIDAKAAIFYEANPAYGLPDCKAVARAIKQIPFKVCFTSFFDETAKLCDLVLPTPVGMERLDDIESPFGCGRVFYGLSRKLMKPQTDNRHGIDVLLAVAGELGLRLPATYEDVLRAKASEMGLGWGDLNDGKTFERGAGTVSASEFSFENYGKMLFDGVKTLQAGHLLTITPMCKNAMGTAQTGIPPFAVKTIRGGDLSGREMSVFVNRKTAAGLGLARNDRVKLTVGQNELTARVNVFNGVADDTVGVYLGFGHTALDGFSQNKGGNLFELLSPTEEAGYGLMAWNKTGVTITKA